MPTSEQPPRAHTPTSDEVARLQEEVAHLQASLATQGRVPRRRGWWRPVVSGFLITIAALLAPLSVVATWASGQIEDTDRYVATVAPLANNADVQEAIAARIEKVVFSYLDLDAATNQLVTALGASQLPVEATETLRALSGPLASGLRTFVADRIEAFVRSDAFASAWEAANRSAHSELVAVLTGKTDGAVVVDRGTVSIDLAVLINAVKSQLADEGFGIAARIPEVNASFALVQSDDLSRVQKLLGFIDDLAFWLPIVGLALVGGAVALARDRRRALLVSGLVIAASMLLLGAALNIIRPLYLDALPASSSPAAAGAVYDQLVVFIRVALRGVLLMALAVAAIAWFSAERGAGAAARRSLTSGINAVRRGRQGAGLDTGRLGMTLGRYRTALRLVIVGVAALAYLAQAHPTGTTALVLLLVTGAVVLLVEVLANDESVETATGTPQRQTVP